MKTINIKRVYDDKSKDDGYRVFVDRLWPRGVSKEDAHFDEWMKELSPSTELRKWFDHKPERFEEFRKRYKKELQEQKEALDKLRELAKTKKITLLFAAKDTEINNAIVIRDVLIGNE
ncbi:MAG: DUF488 domain-containing protein [Dysgonamonadaceae bacterium]|nr:DUF488 domain-containing protein [Dysgonamonadaceae bacterium]